RAVRRWIRVSAPGRVNPLRVALVAGEHSGAQLGFKLMRALREARSGDVIFSGVGGEAMEAEGLKSLFPISDIAVMGILPVLARLPTLIARIRSTAEAIIADRPDFLVIIDSPDFPHRVARRVRAALPRLPIVDYVSPSVWAWRPGRAKAMLTYVDCVLALLPFEPEAYVRLGGPRCVYVGPSLIEEQLKYLIKVPSILLPNLILGEHAIPEKLQKDCAPERLAAALAEIV